MSGERERGRKKSRRKRIEKDRREEEGTEGKRKVNSTGKEKKER